ncbi:hypothetical protein AAG906_004808 [Vitis piasezkii]
MQTRSKSGIYKPKVYTTAIALLDHFQEPSTMEAKYSTLVRNGTWQLNKWIFKTKLKGNGSLDKFKAKLVTKGFQQHASVDFSDIFSPIVKASTIQIIFTLVVAYNWDIQQVDINNAFLNGILHEDVYMCQLQALISRFALKTLGSIGYFLGFEAFRDSSSLYLNQAKYISNLLVKKNMVHVKTSSTPMTIDQKLALEDSAPFPMSPCIVTPLVLSNT